jgi:hypothetical protein
VLALLEERGITFDLHGVDRLIAACAQGNRQTIALLTASEPHLVQQIIAEGGTLLAEFSENGNVIGVRCLLGVGVAALFEAGDPYWDVAKRSTALHVAAWRAWPAAVRELIERGAPVNAVDAKGRTALFLAVKACVDSYWKDRRSPESVAALLQAGASTSGIEIPSGYDPVDELLRQYSKERATG